MKKRILSLFLTITMCITLVPQSSLKANSIRQPKEVSILDMVSDDDVSIPDTLLIEDDGTLTANGENIELSEVVAVSPLKAKSLRSAEDICDYLENEGYVVTKTSEGYEVSTFSTCRLFVTGTKFNDYHGAKEISISGGVSLLSFDSPSDTAVAYEAFTSEGYIVSSDTVFGEELVDASTVSYDRDVIGEYDASVKDSTNSISLTMNPEIMGLTVSASNIVGAQSTTKIGQVGVALIDSGIDSGSNFSSRFPGRVSGGYNVLSNSASAIDDYGHGTFIASIIANNTPSNVKIIPIKAVDSSGKFTASRLAAALQYIVSNSSGINVVNLSLSICTLDSNQMDQIESYINPYIDALYEKGILVVTSAGNKNSTYPNMTADDSYPANYNKVIAVSGIAQNSGKWGSYSQTLTGSCIDFTAPARFIRGVEGSTMNMTKATAANNWNAQYLSLGDGTCVMSGTSQATAFVTAALAQVYSYDTNYAADTAESVLIKNSTKSLIGGGSGKDSTYGYGFPELSAYVYATGSYDNSSNAYSGLVEGFDVVVDSNNSTVTLVKYTGSSDTVKVEDSYVINGKKYSTILGKSTITSGPFSGNTALKSVTIGENVKAQNGDASYLFYGCSGLTSVNRIPSNATDISYAFYGCEKLLQLPSVPSSVTKMDYAFYNCKAASGDSKVDSSVISSAKNAYVGTSVNILVPADSTTYATISKQLESYGKNVTLNGNNSTNTGASASTKEYTVTFHYLDNKVNVSGRTTKTTVKSGTCVKKPKTPTLSGYYFAGWMTSTGEKYDFTKKVTSKMDLYASWKSKKVGTTKITKLKKSSSNYFTVSYQKVSGATGYQIQYSHHSNFQNGGDVLTKKTTRKLHVVHSGTIYVRVRAYKKLGDKYYYGKWSTVKMVKLS